MSDQFADLWSTSAPKPKPQTLSASKPATVTARKPDVFSLLASSTPPPSSRPLTPSARPPAPPKSSGDAFSDLFSSSSTNGGPNSSAKMTLAAKLATEAQQRTPSPQQQPQHSTASHTHSPWAGLDSLDSLSSTAPPIFSSKQPSVADDDWGLGDFGAATTTSRNTPQQPSQSPPQRMGTSTLWDLEEFSPPHSNGSGSDPLLHSDHRPAVSRSSSSQANRKQSSSRLETNSLLDLGIASLDTDFDFGNREGQFDDDEQENDLLGILNAPVGRVKTQTSQSGDVSRHTSGRSNVPRSSSPPPHILGQIVEMGFSVEQAKRALKNTKDRQDVQAALESLLGGNGAAQPSRTEDDRPPASNLTPPPTRTPAMPKGQKERERERLERQRLSAARGSGEGSSRGASVAEIQDQADKLLAQASEIGLSMFSKASAFWKEGKEKVVKAYEERNVDVRGQATPGSRRPKWMQDAVHSDEDDHAERRTGDGLKDQSGFKDTYDHEEREGTTFEPHEPRIKVHEIEVDLFSAATPPQRSSPAPQAKLMPQIARQASSSSSQLERRPPAPSPPLTRNLLTAPPSALALAEKHKTLGTEQFKLGQHAAAAESYTTAIAALPEGHLLLVPLHTNRALARLKTGEYVGAVGDCQKAVEGVFGTAVFSSAGKGAPGRSRANNGGWNHPQGIGVDLLDGYVKALRRAAEACEGREKWVDAGMWWSVLSRASEGEGGSWVEEKTRKEAVSGGVRCRKMVEGSAGRSSVAEPITRTTPAVKPKPKPSPKPTTVLTNHGPSRALRALQSSNAQAESEDAARYALKDAVDARLSAWKTGKEKNIRALLASLELVLWEGAFMKMGMADLVTIAQVKKGYMKAIGRVHPDKLNASNSTLKQRMLANGVFGVLNEAWIAFQTTQN
ncbi:hypothetical protein CPB84DRAFT_1822172 [Gymnopilus junonius]|uniref:UBA domain-containing protein n=1 Tax=Gymnopilus junonius TaxID=109634 RepID=A0A9P5NYC9_GYMJU|nr:hypothetical protein CPB84DRAFT_1822172 [Gymnopilus junonius]